MARLPADALGSQRQSCRTGLPAGGWQRYVASAAGADYSRQHDGPGDDVHCSAGLVSDAGARDDECNPDQAGGPSLIGAASLEQSTRASLNFRVLQICQASGVIFTLEC